MLPAFFGFLNNTADAAHDFTACMLPSEAQEPFDVAHEVAMTPTRLLAGDTGRVPNRFRRDSSDPHRYR